MSPIKNSKSLVRLAIFSTAAVLTIHCSSGSNNSGDSGGSGGDATVGSGGSGGKNNPTGGGAGQSNSAGNTNAGGSSNSGGTAQGGVGGMAAGGTAGASTGGAGGAAGAMVVGGAGGTVAATDTKPWFSFFTTSQAGIISLSADKTNGMGGDLGGLAGADMICSALAQKSNPGDKKVWHAFLSVKAGPNGQPVNAIDRIGKGPWYNFKNKLLAMDLAGLIPGTGDTEGRPKGGDAALAGMFTDENGDPIRPDQTVDNHDTLTGSDKNGKYANGAATCNDWTSTDQNLPAPMIGHAWPRSPNNGRHWISEHPAGGCGKGIDTKLQASNGTKTVGAGGGYGGIYCFAVTGM